MTGRKGRVVSNDDGSISYESRSELDVPVSDSDMPIGLVEETVPIGGLYLNNAMPAGESMRELMSVLDYRAQGTPNAMDDTRAVYTILMGTASPGSRLLFSRE